MPPELYEQTYQNTNHFSFGKNWQSFLKHVDTTHLKKAEESLLTFLGGQEAINGKTFVDIGCGSGLFSLAAFHLGASRVVSVDIDTFSLRATEKLRHREGDPKHWAIEKGSALDTAFLDSLGTFDIVYSWGVLHHTGDMYRALDTITRLTHPKSLLYIALYNKNIHRKLEGSSHLWLHIKRLYNRSGNMMKRCMATAYMGYFILGLIAHGKNPVRYIRSYRSARGMDWYHDILDWLGGYPYEYASPDEIIYVFGAKGFGCIRLLTRDSIACNEYLFKRIP